MIQPTQKGFESEDGVTTGPPAPEGALVLLAQGRLKEAMAKLSALQRELEELGVGCKIEVEMPKLPREDRDADPAEA